MAEQIRECRVFEFVYCCEEKPKTVAEKPCDGHLQATGQQMPIAGGRPLMKHMCNKCGAIKYLNGVFPMPMFIPINDQLPPAWLEKMDPDNYSGQNGALPDQKKILLS